MAITDWPAQERPREKLLSKGASVLSDAELLAIFLRTGVTGKSAVDLARELLRDFGSLRALLIAEKKDFIRHHGLGEAKFAQLQATMEMARRHLAERLQRSSALTSAALTRQYLTHVLRDQPQEQFIGLFLDNQHQVLGTEVLATGTVNAAAVYPREVVKSALKWNASAVIFAHNHPSGLAEPSHADHQLTRRLKEALGLIDISVLDHMVIGEGEIASFAEQGWL